MKLKIERDSSITRLSSINYECWKDLSRISYQLKIDQEKIETSSKKLGIIMMRRNVLFVSTNHTQASPRRV